MRIKLVAIAKDEGLYLPEWTSYHLMLGISQVHIILNGISDQSELICQRISEKYPVTYEFGDELRNSSRNEFDHLIGHGYLTANPLQSRACAKAYAETDPSEFDCILFCDIDEFLFANFDKLEQLLDIYKNFAVIRIKTFVCAGAEHAFMPSIRKGLIGKKWRLTKCLVRTGMEGFKFANSHAVRTAPKQRVYYAGYGLVDRNINRKTTWSDDLFIIHHTLKSEMEYLSLLARGDNIVNTVDGLKANRRGWFSGVGEPLNLPDELIDRTRKHYENLVLDTKLSDIIEIQKAFVKKRAIRVENYIESKINSYNKELADYEKVKKLCSGTYLASRFGL